MVRYPHTITSEGEDTYIQNEETGDYEKNEAAEAFSSECNARPIEYDPEIKGIDGNIVKCDWKVSMPLAEKEFKFGDKVTLTRFDISYDTTVKRQVNGQRNTVLWL